MVKEWHFAARCRERGLPDVSPQWLYDQLRRAFAGKSVELDFAEKVIPLDSGQCWRFGIDGQQHFAVIGPEGEPRTILTAAMVSSKKWKRKKSKRFPEFRQRKSKK